MFCGSSSRCRGLVCSVWLRYFRIILTYLLLRKCQYKWIFSLVLKPQLLLWLSLIYLGHFIYISLTFSLVKNIRFEKMPFIFIIISQLEIPYSSFIGRCLCPYMPLKFNMMAVGQWFRTGIKDLSMQLHETFALLRTRIKSIVDVQCMDSIISLVRLTSWVMDSKVIEGIWNFRCNLHTKGNNHAKYDHSMSKMIEELALRAVGRCNLGLWLQRHIENL